MEARYPVNLAGFKGSHRRRAYVAWDSSAAPGGGPPARAVLFRSARKYPARAQRPARIVADRTITLPRERAASIRSTAEFLAEEHALYEVLVQGEGG